MVKVTSELLNGLRVLGEDEKRSGSPTLPDCFRAPTRRAASELKGFAIQLRERFLHKSVIFRGT